MHDEYTREEIAKVVSDLKRMTINGLPVRDVKSREIGGDAIIEFRFGQNVAKMRLPIAKEKNDA